MNLKKLEMEKDFWAFSGIEEGFWDVSKLMGMRNGMLKEFFVCFAVYLELFSRAFLELYIEIKINVCLW